MIVLTEAGALNAKTINPLVCRITVWMTGFFVDFTW